MIVPQSTITLILNPKMRQRMMRLPVERDAKSGAKKKCPVKRGGTYKLKPSARAPSQVTVTVFSAHEEKLAALSLQDARKEGYASIQGSLEAWAQTYWEPTQDQMVWVVSFARDTEGDVAEFLREEQPVFLARHGDYTLHRSQAIKGESEVLMPLAADLAKARRIAVERRVTPQRQALKDGADYAEKLLETMTNMKARNLVKRSQRNYIAAERLLLSDEGLTPSGDLLHSEASVADRSDRDGSSEGRPHCNVPVASPEAA